MEQHYAKWNKSEFIHAPHPDIPQWVKHQEQKDRVAAAKKLADEIEVKLKVK